MIAVDRREGAALFAAVVSLGLVAVVGCNSAVAPSASPGAPAGSASAGAISADSGPAVTTAPTVIATPTPTAPGTPKPSRVEITAGPTMAIASGRTWYTATELADGRILVVGGRLGPNEIAPCGNGAGACIGGVTPTAEIYEPRTKSFSPTGSMIQPRTQHQAVLLHDGRVLVVGGMNDASGTLGTAEIYDPDTGRFTDLGAMHQDTAGEAPPVSSPEPSSAWRTTVLENQTVIVLADGRVLIAGGEDDLGDSSNAVTVFDPTTNRFSNLPGMPVRWANPAASLLPDGRVLLTAGSNDFTEEALLFDPATNTFTATGPAAMAREGSTQTVLQDGRVLIVNGSDCGGKFPAETYDPATGRFSVSAGTTSSPEIPLLVPDGRVLLLGGADGDCKSLGQVEAYDPDSGTVSLLASGVLPWDVDYAFLLDDGSILVMTNEGASFLTLR